MPKYYVRYRSDRSFEDVIEEVVGITDEEYDSIVDSKDLYDVLNNNSTYNYNIQDIITLAKL